MNSPLGTNTTNKQQPSIIDPKLIKKDPGSSMFMTSDDIAMIKEIQEKHKLDGQVVNVKHLLDLVEDILSRATIRTESTHDQTQSTDHEGPVPDAHSDLIYRISCKIACKCLSGSDDAHGTTVSIFTLVSSYSWDAKLVLILAAFAFNYGEFWLLAQVHSSNSLANSMASLTQLPVILENFNSLKPRFDALTNLMLNVASGIVGLNEILSSHNSPDVPELNTANDYVSIAVYWTIKSVVACATQIHTLSSRGHKYIVSPTEKKELSTFPDQLNDILEHIEELKISCKELIDKKNEDDYVDTLWKAFTTQNYADCTKPLKLLINAKDDIQPLFDGSKKERVDINVLRKKKVLLLISSLDISQDELEIIKQTYSAKSESAQFEVLWIPIVDPSIEWDNDMQTQFENLQSEMTWYTVHDPKLIGRASIRFIREKWQFKNEDIVVVLDKQGKVVSPNAIHMMRIWGSTAFPFTTEREISLWQKERDRLLELLIHGIDQTMQIKEEKYIFLYGGDDDKWIIEKAKHVAHTLKIQLEPVYAGKSGNFWTRLESMFHSKIQLEQDNDEDQMTVDIKKILSYSKSSKGWAVLSKGSSVILTGRGSAILNTLLGFDESWKDRALSEGFDEAIKEYFKKIEKSQRRCSRFEFSSVAWMIPEAMKCPECPRHMEKHITFKCCHED